MAKAELIKRYAEAHKDLSDLEIELTFKKGKFSDHAYKLSSAERNTRVIMSACPVPFPKREVIEEEFRKGWKTEGKNIFELRRTVFDKVAEILEKC